MGELTSTAFEGTSNANVTHGNLITVLMSVVTQSDLIADSADTTSEGYKKVAVEKILKARAARPAKVGLSAAQLDEWLND